MKKKIIFIPILILMILACCGGAYLYSKSGSVDVISVSSLSQYYYGGSSSTSGNVYEAQSQNVYVDSTQIIQEVYVTKDQHVSSGDALIKFDTDSLQLSLSMKQVELEKLKNELQGDQNKLQQLKNTTPISNIIPTPEPTIEPEPTVEPTPVIEKEKVNDAYTLIDSVEDKYVEETTQEESEEGSDISHPIHFLVTKDGKISTEVFDSLKESGYDKTYVRFEYHEDNKYENDILNSWLVRLDQVEYEEKQYFSLPNGTVGDAQNAIIEDGKAVIEEDYSDTNTSQESGYTAVELAKAIQSMESTIRTLKIDIKRKELEITETNQQLTDGVVYASKDGIVTSLQDVNNIDTSTAFLTVSAQKGTYIQGVLPEYIYNDVKVNDTITCTSWMSGSSYTAKIQSIDTYPSSSDLYASSNINCSYYYFYAYIDEDTDFSQYDGIDITFNTSEDTSTSIWLTSPYIRQSKDGSYYVYKSSNGKLTKQTVTIGRSESGYMMEIIDGLSMDDYIAFPYGNKVKEGVSTKISEEGGY